MSRFPSNSQAKRRKRTRWVFLALFSALVAVHVQPAISLQTMPAPTVFELEFPDFKLLPSSQPEITIPSASVNQILLHVLKPAADNIDYGAIGTSINGQAAAGISEIVNGIRGKTVKIDLKLRPGFELVTGTLLRFGHNRGVGAGTIQVLSSKQRTNIGMKISLMKCKQLPGQRTRCRHR